MEGGGGRGAIIELQVTPKEDCDFTPIKAGDGVAYELSFPRQLACKRSQLQLGC